MICALKNTVTGEYLESAVIEDGFLRHTWRKEYSNNTGTLFIMDESTAKRYKAMLEDLGIHTTIMATDALSSRTSYYTGKICNIIQMGCWVFLMIVALSK